MAIIIPIALILTFVYLFLKLIKTINLIDRAKTWPSTEASIRDARSISTESGESRKGRVKNYLFAVYEVNDVQFGTTKLSCFESSAALERKTMRLLLGSLKTTVFYDPSKPHISTIIPPAQIGFFMSYVKITIVGLLAILTLYLVI